MTRGHEEGMARGADSASGSEAREVAALLGAGRWSEALCRLSATADRRGSMAGLKRALKEHQGLLAPDGDTRRYHRLLGDGQTLMLRLGIAAAEYEQAGDAEGLERLLGLAMDLGRLRELRHLLERLPTSRHPTASQIGHFMRERVLPGAAMGGSAQSGFWVDEAVVAEAAAALKEPVATLAADIARMMRVRGSTQLAKVYVLARLGDDADLLRAVEADVEQRLRWPRAALGSHLATLVRSRGGCVGTVLQAGDDDDWNPLSAKLFAGELRGLSVVYKEHLRLPVGYDRVDGLSDEGGLLASLHHPDIVRLHERLTLGPHEVLVLERVPGFGLDQVCTPGTLLPQTEALRIGARMAGVLDYLHEQGIVYLDLKARNIIKDGDQVTLLDFGMAQRLAPGAEEVATLPSTPACIPPEIARRLRAGRPADLFQLGLLLCELLTGRHAFAHTDFLEGDDLRESEVVKYALATLYPAPGKPDLPDIKGLAELMASLLDPLPARRPTAAQAREVLQGMASCHA